MTRPSRALRLAAAAAAAALALSACGSDDDGGDDTSSDSGSESSAANVYFVDGNTADYSEDFDEGTLEGVKATYPGADIGDDFRDRLLEVDPDLDSFTYGPESYDATILVGLAALQAGKDSGKAIGSELSGVSNAPGTQCSGFSECADLIESGEEIDYEGVSGPINFGPTGSPTAATIGIFEYGADNTFSPVDFLTGEIAPTDAQAGQEITGNVPNGDGTLTIGSLLPESGDLAFLGPPEVAGVQLAVNEMNEAGGVQGKDVAFTQADSGDGTPNIAPGETDRLLNANVDAVIGAASSSVSLSVIDKITNAGVVHFSPANTSTAFDTYKDKGLYFRTAPSDVLQGRVMADLLLQDGHQNVAILARQDSYGEALADQVEQFFTESGGTIVAKTLYQPDAPNFTAEVDGIAGEDPDATVVIAFDETKKIMPEMISAGIGPN
ncbi:substrate-binding family protein [Mumia flava]|uniref:Substrate-binding family protein n=1 Tax=Mumia flava TaxID=1348852 RepID=A0A2M9BDH1_9ACTN|nr:ABC transporter substrate-binding protein [Mumia flava]PJJ55979.1 substrate-binding family protein [Mumia flava]